MIRAALLSACLVVLAGCATGPRQPYPAHRAECERQGWPEGSNRFNRCIRSLEGREVLDRGRLDRRPFDH